MGGMIHMTQEISPANHLGNAIDKLTLYVKLANYDGIKNRLMQILNSDDKKCVFEVTDGKNSTREIEAMTGVNKDVVSNWWNQWQKEGIVEESEERRGRRRKVLSLSDFGIDIPNHSRK
jgi:hypothetical protein